MTIAQLHPAVMNPAADKALLVTSVAYLLLNGAQLFETAVLVPVWTAAPPASLHMFQGSYGLDFKNFWIIAHSLHEFTLLAALILNWKIPYRRRALLLIFFIHLAVRAWTLLYFAPVIISFQHLSDAAPIDVALQQKASLWKNLNIVRVSLFVLLSFMMIPLNRANSGIKVDHAQKPTR